MGKKKNRQVVFHFCYPKPPKGLNSPQGMLSITEQHPSESNKFKNPSIDMSRGMFQGLSQELGNEEGEELTCEQYDNVFICLDVFDIQLPYEANVRGILKVMREDFPTLYDEYIALTKLKYEALDYVLQLDGQSLKGTPVVAWGDVPHEACLRGGNPAFDWSFKKVHNVKLNCHSIHKVNHPCSFIDLRHCATKIERYKSNDVSLTIASNHIAGHMLQSGQVIEETWCIDFYHQKTPQIEARRRRCVTLAANPSQAQQDQRTEFVKRSRTASKKKKAGIVDNDPYLTNLIKKANHNMNSNIEIDSAAWKRGIRDPTKYPNHKKWLKAGTSKKQTITHKSKFQEKFQNWQKDVKKGVKENGMLVDQSQQTKGWICSTRKRFLRKSGHRPLTETEYQLLSEHNFPFTAPRFNKKQTK